MSEKKHKGLCSYCLGEKEIIFPKNNDPKEAEANNFVSQRCPVCDGTGESESEDTFEDDYDEDYPLLPEDVIIPDDLDEFLENDEEEDTSSNDINNQS